MTIQTPAARTDQLIWTTQSISIGSSWQSESKHAFAGDGSP